MMHVKRIIGLFDRGVVTECSAVSAIIYDRVQGLDTLPEEWVEKVKLVVDTWPEGDFEIVANWELDPKEAKIKIEYWREFFKKREKNEDKVSSRTDCGCSSPSQS